MNYTFPPALTPAQIRTQVDADPGTAPKIRPYPADSGAGEARCTGLLGIAVCSPVSVQQVGMDRTGRLLLFVNGSAQQVSVRSDNATAVFPDVLNGGEANTDYTGVTILDPGGAA